MVMYIPVSNCQISEHLHMYYSELCLTFSIKLLAQSNGLQEHNLVHQNTIDFTQCHVHPSLAGTAYTAPLLHPPSNELGPQAAG